MSESPVIPALPKLTSWQTVLFKDVYKICTLHPMRTEEALMVVSLVLAQLMAEQAIAAMSASRAACEVENALPDTSHLGSLRDL